MSIRQSHVTFKHAFFGVFLVGVGVAAGAGEAAAQRHIHQPHIPEIEIYDAVAPESGRVSDYDDADRLLWDLGAWVASEPGVGPEPTRAFGTLYWGRRISRTTWVAARSQLRLTLPESAGQGLDGEALEGSHRVVARVGLGDPREIEIGTDTKIDARFDHVGSSERRAVPAIDIGRGAYTDAAIDAEMALRKTNKAHGPDAAGMAFPVHAGYRQIDYLDPSAPLARAESRTVGAGMAFRMYDRHALDGAVTLLGLTYTRTDLIGAASTLPAAEAGVVSPDPMDTLSVTSLSKTRLDFGKMEMAFYEKNFVLAARGGYGWEWLRDSANGRAVNLFAPDVGIAAHDEHLSIALGYGRTAQHSADGRRFAADWRLGLDVAYTRARVGGAFRAEASWLNDKERDQDNDPGILGRYAASSELWYGISHELQLGVYDVATYGLIDRPGDTSWDPWAADRGVTVEMGAFLRWTGR